MSVESISEVLGHALSGDPWHGPSLDALLADVTEEEAEARPVARAHSIKELVLHLAAWAHEAAARAEGRAPRPPDDADWPDGRGLSFTQARERLAAAHRGLASVLAKLPQARLAEVVGGSREAALGTGVTFERMLVGVAEHDAYHAGQIAILKRALRG